jgi:glycosyltransferase involved in cell wall biosynthesis
MPPKVSIIVPLHNKGEFLAEALESVQRQSLPGWEMIVVENGSEDDGPAIVEKFVARDSRIRLLRAPATVRGPGAARNAGLEMASGEWVLFLDADDMIEPDHLACLIAAGGEEGEVDLVAGGWKEFGSDKGAMETRWPTAFGRGVSELVEASIAFAPWAVHAALVRREWLNAHSIRWFEDLDGWPSEDSAFWFAALQGARVEWADSSGALYRVDTANSRNAAAHRAKWLQGLRCVVSKNLETLAQQGGGPSGAQLATLVRVYESRYREAVRARDLQAAEGFRQDALLWLKKAPWWDLGMLVRRLRGIH